MYRARCVSSVLDSVKACLQVPLRVPLGGMTAGTDRLNDALWTALAQAHNVVLCGVFCVGSPRSVTGLASDRLVNPECAHVGPLLLTEDGRGCMASDAVGVALVIVL